MTDATVDGRGRLTLPKEVRERFGDRFYGIELQDSIDLIPVADDTLWHFATRVDLTPEDRE